MTPPANTCADCTCACVLQWRCAELRAKCYKCGIYYVDFADLELKRSACAAQSRPVIARPPFCNGALWGLCLEKEEEAYVQIFTCGRGPIAPPHTHHQRAAAVHPLPLRFLHHQQAAAVKSPPAPSHHQQAATVQPFALAHHISRQPPTSPSEGRS